MLSWSIRRHRTYCCSLTNGFISSAKLLRWNQHITWGRCWRWRARQASDERSCVWHRLVATRPFHLHIRDSSQYIAAVVIQSAINNKISRIIQFCRLSLASVCLPAGDMMLTWPRCLGLRGIIFSLNKSSLSHRISGDGVAAACSAIK